MLSCQFTSVPLFPSVTYSLAYCFVRAFFCSYRSSLFALLNLSKLSLTSMLKRTILVGLHYLWLQIWTVADFAVREIYHSARLSRLLRWRLHAIVCCSIVQTHHLLTFFHVEHCVLRRLQSCHLLRRNQVSIVGISRAEGPLGNQPFTSIVRILTSKA